LHSTIIILSFAEQLKVMDIQNTQSQMRKGVLEFCILSIIGQGEVYPSDIVEKMKAANLHILEGTLYPLLTRLKNAGLLNYRWVESVSGPPRKYFMMTPEGHQALALLLNTWNEMANAVHQITQNTNPIESSEASSALS
jgi:PadR family transcriptional regulator PadR